MRNGEVGDLRRLVVFGGSVACGHASGVAIKLNGLVWMMMHAFVVAFVIEWVFRGVLVAVGLFAAPIDGWISGLAHCAGFAWLWSVRRCHASNEET